MTLTPLLDLLFVMIFVALLKTDGVQLKTSFSETQMQHLAKDDVPANRTNKNDVSKPSFESVEKELAKTKKLVTTKQKKIDQLANNIIQLRAGNTELDQRINALSSNANSNKKQENDYSLILAANVFQSLGSPAKSRFFGQYLFFKDSKGHVIRLQSISGEVENLVNSKTPPNHTILNFSCSIDIFNRDLIHSICERDAGEVTTYMKRINTNTYSGTITVDYRSQSTIGSLQTQFEIVKIFDDSFR